jgi:hypothetical protein
LIVGLACVTQRAPARGRQQKRQEEAADDEEDDEDV